MASRGTKWLLGCGIGCGLLIVLLVAAGVIVGVAVKRTIEPIVAAGESHEALVSDLGAIEDYRPELDGSIPASRLELFLWVRESLAEPRERIETWFDEISVEAIRDEDSVLRTIMNALGEVREIIGPVGGYVETRNRALLEEEMSLGEYLYIYTTAYYSRLGHRPEDAAEIEKENGRREAVFGDPDGTFAPGRIRERYHRFTGSVLRNQLRDLETEEGMEEWRETLSDELRRFESNPDTVAWQNGLPPAIATSLEPYLDRLEAAYSAALNPFEFPPDRDWVEVRVE